MRVTRKDEVYTKIKREILTWELSPGAPLFEPDLSMRLGASRTPIREALQQLSQEGLVRLIPRKGAFVSDVSIPDMVELLQMRQALESLASRLAATSAQRTALGAFIPELRAAPEIIEPGDNATYYELASRIDDKIAELAGNQRLRLALRGIWDQVFRARRLAASNPERLLQTVDEHLRIVEAIVAGDGEAAAAAAHEHIRRSLVHMLDSLPQRSVTTGPFHRSA